MTISHGRELSPRSHKFVAICVELEACLGPFSPFMRLSRVGFLFNHHMTLYSGLSIPYFLVEYVIYFPSVL